MDIVVAITKRLLLRQWTLADADAVAPIYADPQTMRYFGDGSTFTAADVARSFPPIIEDYTTVGYGNYAVVLRDTNTIIGHAGVRYIAGRARCEVDCLVDRRWWRRGYALEALQAVMQRSFRIDHVPRIAGIAHADNAASIALMRRLGMQQQEHLIAHGVPSVLYTIDASAFRLPADVAATLSTPNAPIVRPGERSGEPRVEVQSDRHGVRRRETLTPRTSVTRRMGRIDVSPLIAPYRYRSTNYGKPNFPLSDHLPMAIAALAEMGASPQRIAGWARAYAARYPCIAPASERDARRAWHDRIVAIGMRGALAEAIAQAGDGIGAAAFHAVIRAAYALERNDDDELACALESWEREYLALPVLPVRQRAGVHEALAALARSHTGGDWPGLITRAMERAADGPWFDAIAMTVPSANAIDALAVAAAAGFARTSNFTALHVMTGTHALRVLRAYVDDVDAIMPAFWRAFVAAALTTDALPSLDPGVLAPLRAQAPPAWPPLLAEAIDHDDEHVIKATYTAWRLDAELDDPIFRTAAERFLISRRPRLHRERLSNA